MTLATALPELPDGGVTITGPGATKFTIDGKGANRIFLLLGSRTATISGLTATNGNSTLSGDMNGGAIENEGTLTLDHVTVSNSTTDGGNGGGIASEAGSTLTLLSSTVTGNKVNASGGGIYTLANTTIRDSTVSKNTAGGCSFGGGIEVGSSGSPGGSLTMTGSSISDNVVTGGCKQVGGVGGGIDEQAGSSMTIAQSTISGNHASYTAGGMRVGGTATVSESTFSDNSAVEFAGGIGVSSFVEFQAGSLTLMNSTVSGNSSSGTGGGIGNFNGATLVSDTIASNSAVQGGANVANDINSKGIGGNSGFQPNSGISFENTIVADPKMGTPPPPPLLRPALVSSTATNCENSTGTAFTSKGFNLEDDAANPTTSMPPSCNFTQSTDQSGVDPKLGPLADNAGPTQTRALLTGSPAIDKGTTDGLTVNGMAGRVTDQRGVIRPAGPQADIGAFELALPTAVTGSASNITSTSATVSGTATNPDVTGGQAFFEYGPASNTTSSRVSMQAVAAGSWTSMQAVAPGANGAAISAQLTGLRPATLYHYRLIVTNGDGTSTGEDRTFMTPAAPAKPKAAPPAADLALGARARPGRVRLGDRFAYTLTLTNHGPDRATGVVVRDRLPGQVRFVSVRVSRGGSCTGRGTVVCRFSSLRSGGQVRVVITVRAVRTGHTRNAARVSGAQHDPRPANNVAAASAMIVPRPHPRFTG